LDTGINAAISWFKKKHEIAKAVQEVTSSTKLTHFLDSPKFFFNSESEEEFRMKKIVCSLLFTALAAALFAQEFTLSGEVKTGLLWNKNEDKYDESEITSINSKDYAGDSEGRFMLNMEYAIENVGVKLRFKWEKWTSPNLPALPYAFGYGNFFDDQLTVSVGKLGASPWGTGGPEMWVELEDVSKGGMRLECKPSFVPGLNVGFILNGFDGSTVGWKDENNKSKPITFLHILRESAIGAAYTHEFFYVNAAYRFDSEVDNRFNTSASNLVSGKDGGDLVYRVEERVLRNILPGFQVWAQGYFTGIGADKDNEKNIGFNNLLYLQYAPDLFTVEIRFGYGCGNDFGYGCGNGFGYGLDETSVYSHGLKKVADFNQSIVHVKPGFYLNLFGKKLVVGGSFWYGQDFGDGKIYKDSPFLFMEVEPKIQYNISPNMYMALVYNYSRGYVKDDQKLYADKDEDPITQNHWVNLRFGLSF
jgi:hypothetical protein